MRVRFSAAAMALVLASWFSVAPSASTGLPADFAAVTREAALIVRGRVTDVRAFRTPAGDVDTAATVRVAATLKGGATSSVVMRLPGGTIGRYRSIMPGAPQVRAGDSGVFFLKQVRGGAWWPVGLNSGIYRVTESQGRATVVPPVVAGVTTDRTGIVTRGDVRRRTLPLSEFESLVQLVSRSRSGGAR